LRLFSFGGYGLAPAALALVVFGAYDSYPLFSRDPYEGRVVNVISLISAMSFLDPKKKESIRALRLSPQKLPTFDNNNANNTNLCDFYTFAGSFIDNITITNPRY